MAKNIVRRIGFLQKEYDEPVESPPNLRKEKSAVAKSPIYLGFDSAKTTDDNREHWANADDYSANSAITPEVRRILRSRCRYEIANNSYARGVVLTLANDTIGTGPRLQLLTDNAVYNRETEHVFATWSQAINLPAKLRVMRMARIQDGEAFAYLFFNPHVQHPIKLDIGLIEADRVTSAKLGASAEEVATDGIILDKYGNPIAYEVLTCHPGDQGFSNDSDNKILQIRANDILHFYRVDRPGQHRGIPEITPALPLFAQLRRFTLAVISAAEAAADFAGVLYTDTQQEKEDEEDGCILSAGDKVRLQKNTLLALSGGYKLQQIDPKQPASTYAEFKREILNEIARYLNIPYNVAAGNSSGYNYASGRLDHQTYFKSIKVDQHSIGLSILDPILKYWIEIYQEADHNPAIEIDSTGCCLPPHTWFWDGTEHVDPAKEATALEKRLSCGATSYPAEFARQGKDYETEMNSQAKALGISPKEYQALLRQKLFGITSQDYDLQEKEDSE